MKCFAHHHMTFEQYGLWTHAREVSHQSGVFYFGGRQVAERFRNTGKDAAYRVAQSLVHEGWFVTLKKSKRDRKTGIFKPAQYQPVSHDEWAAEYPGRCTQRVEESRDESSLEIQTGSSLGIQTGESATSPEIQNNLSRNPDTPVEISRPTCLEFQKHLSGNPDIIGKRESDREKSKRKEGKRENSNNNNIQDDAAADAGPLISSENSSAKAVRKADRRTLIAEIRKVFDRGLCILTIAYIVTKGLLGTLGDLVDLSIKLLGGVTLPRKFDDSPGRS
jgi:hypothetical protein